MSLWEKGTGILETYVTWEDVVYELQQADYYCQFGENCKFTDIGKGNGFLSKIALVEPDWQEKTCGLPDKFVIKICSQLTQAEFDPSSRGNMELEKKFREAHNFEVMVYNILEKHNRSGFALPKVFASRSFTENNQTKGFIVMEFIEDAVIQHVVENVDEDSLTQGLNAIVDLIAITPKMTAEERKGFPTNVFENLCGTFFNTDLVSMQSSAVRSVLGEENRVLADEFESVAKRRLTIPSFREMDAVPDTLGMQRVLSHGDLWSTNVLWKKGEHTKFQLAAIIDFQSIHMGSAATDFITFVCSSMSGVTRRQLYYNMQLEFYTNVCERFPKPPFTLEQFLESCKRMFPFCAYNVATTLASIYPELMTQGKPVPDFQQVFEKTKCLIEDIVAYDQEIDGL